MSPEPKVRQHLEAAERWEREARKAAKSEGGHEGHWMIRSETEIPAAAAPASVGDLALSDARVRIRAKSLGDFLGRTHPMAVHFPLALLLMAALAELMIAARPAFGLEPTVRFLTGAGALGAIIAALLGWFAAGWRLSDRSETLAMHRWNGSAIALLSLVAWALAARRQGNRSGLRIVLGLLAIALIAQGYLGGEMVFGPNHLGLE